MPAVKKQIIKFVDQFNLRDEVMAIFDIENDRKDEKPAIPASVQDHPDSIIAEEINAKESTTKIGSTTQGSSTQNPEPYQLGSFQLEQLGDWAELIRSDVRIMDYKNGWFGKNIRCVYGGDIYRWILEHVESNEKRAAQICQKMLEKEIITSVDQKLDFSKIDIYRMYMDREDIADNMLRRWRDSVRGALEVSSNLVKLIESVYEAAIVQPENDDAGDDEEEFEDGVEKNQPECMINAEAALKSTQYKAYLNAACELERINLQKLSVRERIAFFLNIHQCMYIHYFLKVSNENKTVGQGTNQKSYISALKALVMNTK